MSKSSQSAIDKRVRSALSAIAAGRPVVVVDDQNRENEGDLIFAAELATPTLVSFTVRHTSGFLCVALAGEMCDRLNLIPMTHANQDRYQTAYQVTVDLVGTCTGISAKSRAATIAALGSDDANPEDFSRPGHVVPLRARAGGVLERPGHTEAAVDLARLAGRTPAGALCEIVSVDRPNEMAKGEELARFALEHGLVHLSVADIIDYRLRHETQFTRVTEAALPTSFGQFLALGYSEYLSGNEYLALVAGTGDGRVPVYVHAECLCGDVFGAVSCTCRGNLDRALTEFGRTGRGVVIYLRPDGRARACGLLQADTPPQPGPEIVVPNILADLGLDAVYEFEQHPRPAGGVTTATQPPGSNRAWAVWPSPGDIEPFQAAEEARDVGRLVTGCQGKVR
ncbi:3,4-dihydroxy-2-butanone-4-phosphate synthase [Amycolatopsis methanolica]|uniref:3,4-dihydroxy-2-butanone-4-phosphate synthase n=1 Tax=Amycolatopsis methanolica TaxID=1814 RepID=UPI0009DB4242|nr:3,4-dihydroxy-2-butanone-4-phosphate synthase [Amycolatopsis methanolica]